MRRLLGPRLGARRLATPAIHVFVLSAFAVAQPLYYLFSRNAEFFAARGSTPADIVVFALGVLLVPPAALMLVEWIAAQVGERVWRVVHVVFVAGLAALVLLQGEKRIAESRGASLIVLALLAGAAAAAVYLRFAWARSFLTVLAPAPFIFAALFLFNSPVTELLHAEEHPVQAAAVDARVPVVFVMFDELGTVGLLGADGQLNAERYPNFAALAADSTFYRDATTVHAYTEHAVPSALTGQLPDKDELPIYAHHRQNLFTLLGNGYRLKVRESLTHLCPVSLCRPTDLEPAGERLTSLASDTWLVYLHVVLPDSMALGLPPVDQTWRDFRGMNVTADTGGNGPVTAASGCAPVCGFVQGMSASEPASLHYLHVQIPHIPWRYLPSGKRYIGDTRTVPGLTSDRAWEDEPFLVDQAYQRYLLQVGYTDRALGIILRRLKRTKLYDRALVVVMADHGVSFQPKEPRRDANAATVPDVAFVPLFVKLPEQQEGKVVDGFVRTIDILPTIADELGVALPEPVDGRSLLEGSPDADGAVRVMGKRGDMVEASLAELLAKRDETLARWSGMFGGAGWDGLYRGGPSSELVGRRLDDLDVGSAEDASVELDSRALLAAYDPAGALSPAWVTGRIDGVDPGVPVAIAVNGSVVATTETYGSGGETRLAVFVPEESLRQGENEVDVLAIGPGGALQLIEPAAPALVLDGNTLRRADGREIELVPETIRGEVGVRAASRRAIFSGWAVDAERGSPVDAIAVFVDGELVYVARGVSFHTLEPEQHEGIDDAGFAHHAAGEPRAPGRRPRHPGVRAERRPRRRAAPRVRLAAAAHELAVATDEIPLVGDDEIEARPADDPVAAVVPREDDVVADPAVELVDPLAADQLVRPHAAGQPVVSVLAAQHVVSALAQEHLGGLAPADRLGGRRSRHLRRARRRLDRAQPGEVEPGRGRVAEPVYVGA